MAKVHQDLENSEMREECIGNKSVHKETAEVKDQSEEKPKRSKRIFSKEERARAIRGRKEF